MAIGLLARDRLHGKLLTHPHTLLTDIDEAEIQERAGADPVVPPDQ